MRNSTEWTHCLEKMHIKQQNLQYQAGYLVQYSKILPLTASPSHVIDTTQSGEVQCCSEFQNVTPSSHICFRYYPTITQIFKSKQQENVEESKINVTPALNFAESLGLKNRVKRANIIKVNFFASNKIK